MGEETNSDMRMKDVAEDLRSSLQETQKINQRKGDVTKLETPEEMRKRQIDSAHAIRSKVVPKIKEILKRTYEDEKLDSAVKILVNKGKEDIVRLIQETMQSEADHKEAFAIMARMNAYVQEAEKTGWVSNWNAMESDNERLILLLEKEINLEKAISKLSERIQQILDEVKRTS